MVNDVDPDLGVVAFSFCLFQMRLELHGTRWQEEKGIGIARRNSIMGNSRGKIVQTRIDENGTYYTM